MGEVVGVVVEVLIGSADRFARVVCIVVVGEGQCRGSDGSEVQVNGLTDLKAKRIACCRAASGRATLTCDFFLRNPGCSSAPRASIKARQLTILLHAISHYSADHIRKKFPVP